MVVADVVCELVPVVVLSVARLVVQFDLQTVLNKLCYGLLEQILDCRPYFRCLLFAIARGVSRDGHFLPACDSFWPFS